MSDSGNGGGPPDPERTGPDTGAPGTGGAPRPAEVPPGLVIGICSGVIVWGLMKAVSQVAWLGTLVTAAATVAACVLLGWLATRGPVKAVLRKLFPRVPRGAVTAACWFAAGAAAMTLVLTAGAGAYQVVRRAGPCGQPLELRVATGPATIRPLRQAAAEFENDDESKDHGCAKYSVSVAAEPDPVQLNTAFGEQWRRGRAAGGLIPDNDHLFGPQPDIWIPSSTAEFEYVEGTGRSGSESTGAADPDEGRPEFRKQPSSLGRSPMTLALFKADHAKVADPRAKAVAADLGDLLGRLSAAHLDLSAIARPVPETSAAALAVTPALYTRTPDADNRADERFAAPPGLVAPDAVSLLCRFRKEAAAGGKPPEHIAVAVPEQLLSDYDLGLPLGDDQCEGVDPGSPEYAGWQLFPLYSADLPMLDYPFVQVTWPGQGTGARTAAVHAFRDWLGRNPLTAQGFRDGQGRIPATGRDDQAHYYLSRLETQVGGYVMPDRISLNSPGGMQSTLNEISRARPKVSLSLMLDVSGSMGSTAKGHGSTRLAQGVSFLRSLVTQLQDSDNAVLRMSSSARAPEGGGRTSAGAPPPMMSADQESTVLRRLQDATPEGSDRSLTKMIKDADLGSGRTNLVLVTDGQALSTNKDLSAERLSAEFRGEHPDARLIVVLAGPSDCAAQPVRKFVDALEEGGGSDCRELNADPGEPERQAAELMLDLRLGGED